MEAVRSSFPRRLCVWNRMVWTVIEKIRWNYGNKLAVSILGKQKFKSNLLLLPDLNFFAVLGFILETFISTFIFYSLRVGNLREFLKAA